MTAKQFFDTNILIYSADDAFPDRQRVARAWLEPAADSGCAFISTQVLQETYVNAIRKAKLSPERAALFVQKCSAMHVVDTTRATVLAAIDVSRRVKLSLWDALIVVAAAHAGCDELVTEDLNHGQVIEGVQIVNPFKKEGTNP